MKDNLYNAVVALETVKNRRLTDEIIRNKAKRITHGIDVLKLENSIKGVLKEWQRQLRRN